MQSLFLRNFIMEIILLINLFYTKKILEFFFNHTLRTIDQ